MNAYIAKMSKPLMPKSTPLTIALRERDEARKLALKLAESGDPKPWKVEQWNKAKRATRRF